MAKPNEKLKFGTPLPIDDDLGWIDLDDTVNIQALLGEGGITDPDEITAVTRDLLSSPALRVIRAIVAKRYRIASSKESAITDATWPLRVAFIEGYKKALSEIYRSIPVNTGILGDYYYGPKR